MRDITTLLAALTILTACGNRGTEPPTPSLVKLEVDEGPVENGKHLKMTFTELERKGSISEIAVKFTSGGSVSSIMVEVRGQCLIAESRGAKYFWPVGETRTQGDLWLSTVEYSNARGTHAKVTSIDDCKLMGLIK